MIPMQTKIYEMITLADLFSLANALCGILSVIVLLQGQTQLSAQLLLLAVVFDSVDGYVARNFGNNDISHVVFGETIDSLADVVSFAVAPSIILYIISGVNYIIIPVILIVLCGILRLTRYNALLYNYNQPVQTFVGLPIPVVSFTLAGLILADYINMIFLFILMIIISILMISDISYPKVKEKRMLIVVAIITLLCIVPYANTILFKIPSYLLIICALMYILAPLITYFIEPEQLHKLQDKLSTNSKSNHNPKNLYKR